MDVELLSKMVKELILDNDRVVLPGMGAFQAEMVPASFSDRGYTINPPYRKLVFRSADDSSDTLLSDFYAAANGIPADVAADIIKEYVSSLKDMVATQRTVALPGLGKLRAARAENVFFIPDEDLDIYPAGMGLDPISLKSHLKPTSFDFAGLGLEDLGPAAVATVAEPEDKDTREPEVPEVTGPESEPESIEPETAETEPEVVEPEPEETESEPQEAQEPSEPETPETQEVEEEQEPQEPETPAVAEVDPEEAVESEPETPQTTASPKKKSGVLRAIIITLLTIIVIVALLFAAFMLMAEYAPDILDKLLYTQEELEILNYGK
ncbi:MAG: hypothetical protein MJY67_07065 [Bacteroidales bacterium]|nr:hypothetical protein [Bacteroidales bacterium]